MINDASKYYILLLLNVNFIYMIHNWENSWWSQVRKYFDILEISDEKKKKQRNISIIVPKLRRSRRPEPPSASWLWLQPLSPTQECVVTVLKRPLHFCSRTRKRIYRDPEHFLSATIRLGSIKFPWLSPNQLVYLKKSFLWVFVSNHQAMPKVAAIRSTQTISGKY